MEDATNQQPESGPAAEGDWFLVICEDNQVKVEPIGPQPHSIGRSDQTTIQLKSIGISRHHASVYFEHGEFWILDGDLEGNRSTNGLQINGQPQVLHRLCNGDVITFCRGVQGIFLSRRTILKQSEAFLPCLDNLLGVLSGSYGQGSSTTKQTFVHEPADLEVGAAGLDDLTKLPNRNAFIQRLNRIIHFKEQVKQNHAFAVLFIDLDKFKLINDSLGHHAGDQFLIKVSERMGSCLRTQDMLARLGGDEFVVLINGIKDVSEAIHIAERLQKSLEASLWIDRNEIFPSASIGVASSEVGCKSAEEILRDADTAMYQAKSAGRGRLEVFDETMRQQSMDLLKLDADLRRAIQQQEFRLYYQPIISLKARRLVGFEALLRWQHPERGLLHPGEFIQHLEDKNLIHPVGQWVLGEACQQLSQWQNNPRTMAGLSVSMNLSSKQLIDRSLPEKLLDQTRLHGLAISDIKIEVTENIVMDENQSSMQALNRLKDLGIHIYIDDFGTGYSSLSYLHKFPVTALKIDRSFITEIDKKGDESIGFSVTQSIIGLAHNLGVKVVAEGIENVRHLIYLKASGCDFGQGYLFSEPLDVAQATALVEEGLPWPWKC